MIRLIEIRSANCRFLLFFFVCVVSHMDIDFIAVAENLNCRMQFEIRLLSAINHIDHMRSIRYRNCIVMLPMHLKKTKPTDTFH